VQESPFYQALEYRRDTLLPGTGILDMTLLSGTEVQESLFCQAQVYRRDALLPGTGM
jgi:hypothetical protein